MRVLPCKCFKRFCHILSETRRFRSFLQPDERCVVRVKTVLHLWLGAVVWGLVFLPSVAFPKQELHQKPCSDYSDHFDTLNPERWQEVLLYSKARGTVAVQDRWLHLKTPADEPCEIQVYSLFCFDGDFDIQADYDFANPGGLPLCRFNTGLVVQTLGDEKSYKCYIAAAQKEDFLFRGRVDVAGEKNLELYKGMPAPRAGVIRIVRKAGHLSFLTLEASAWRTLYAFVEPCHEKLRVRFKLQTSGDEENMQPCPVEVKFKNFTVNSCEKIVEE
jgi:hypothetical protein